MAQEAAAHQAPREPGPLEWPQGGLAFGGDYNPEQWPPEVWPQDVALMREAGVTLVTVGVFSWSALEPREGRYEFGWLDRVLDLLHGAGIGVDLATPTASPPPWLLRAHPGILPVRADGTRLGAGGRLGWCPSNPDWRRHSLRIVRALGERYGDHPAVRLWHVGNEYGNGNRMCHCADSAAHFRRWLAARYPSLDALNDAWGTAFWGHHYADFEEIDPPRDAGMPGNPGLVLDFGRFSSDALLAQYDAERQVLAELSPDRPATTNFMVGAGPHVVDHSRWAPRLDVVATDHYTTAADPERVQELAFSADRTRGLSPGRPWLLMEHAAGAVSWQPRNLAKEPGELALNSLAHVARGSDGALFFQWRQSVAGSEQYHSAMLPHAGTRTRVWREVRELGGLLRRIGEVAGSTVPPAQVALLVDDESAWAWEAGPKPHQDLRLEQVARRYHRALWRRNVPVDVVAPGAAWEGARVLLVPGLYLTADSTARRVEAFARAGGRVVVTYLSGVVDGANRVRTGGYPGAFRELLGVWVEEFHPLLDEDRGTLDNGWAYGRWSEHLHADDAEVVAAYTAGALAGRPAVTRRTVGRGEVWYVSADLDAEPVAALLEQVLTGSGVRPVADAPDGVEAVRRVSAAGSYLFLLNHGRSEARVPAAGRELVGGREVTGEVVVAARSVAVVREERPTR
ncbi:beta-galactosidase [Actinacidiphila sp. bgisy144]|uniref:beta-galactosidase n=1 Tax=Actinacidiphila sp. bgisy144 TaxID=3413791 RepID=UPI003EBB1225